MCRGRRFGVAGSWTVVLGAVLYGCALFVPAVGTAAGITVEIIKPDKDPVVFDAGKEHEFEAVAFVEGQELPGGSVTWDWNFGDGTDHSAANPTTHTYTARGSYHVVVMATYGTLSGQAELNVQAAWAGSEDAIESFVTEFRYELYDGPKLSGQVSDLVSIVVRQKEATPYWVGVRWCRDGLFLYPGQSWEINWGYIDGEYCRFANFPWSTADKHNGVSSAWQAEVAFEVSPPPGQQGPCIETVLLPAMTASPLNMVVHAGGPLIIDHKAGTAAETLTWSSIHLDNPTAGVPRVYDALVQVFSLSGAEIDRGTAQFTINQQGSWDWHPDLGGPPEGGDSDGLYTFLVTSSGSVEDMDTDKVDMLTGVDNASESDKMHIDWDTLTLKGKIKYTAVAELASPVLHIQGPSPTDISLPTEAGTHEVPYEVPIGYGTFYAVITATQTAAQAANNRDEVAKPVLPKGCWLGNFAGPPTAVEIIEPNQTPPYENDFCFGEQADPNATCEVSASGRVVDHEYLNSGLLWAIQAMAGSTLATLPASRRGPQIVFTYTRLPASNSSFGPKDIVLTHPLVASGTDTETVRIFYRRLERNHPANDGTANWYYYWCQGVVDALPQFTYTNGIPGYAQYDAEEDTLKVSDLASGSIEQRYEARNLYFPELSYDVSQVGSKVFCCALLLAHELSHKATWRGSAADGDHDGLSDDFENSTRVPGGYWLNPDDSDTYNMAAIDSRYAWTGDSEFLARIAGHNASGGANPDADWSMY